METRLSLTLRQVLWIILVVILLAVGFTLAIFFLGQRSGFNLALSATPSLVPTATMPALPKAMTATPKPLPVEQITLTDDSATQFLQDQLAQAGSEAPIQVQRVSFTAENVSLSGSLDYLEYQGMLNITGLPVVTGKKLHFQLIEVTLDGAVLPEVLYPTVEQQIDSLFEQLLTGYELQKIELGPGWMTLTVLKP
ncbi:MAG: hypothetical protein JXB15_13565 [Anaerolineales bacterium]|nr:hypothetical protein [Anaerolineales bacterium]